jgi:hypothetical protein
MTLPKRELRRLFHVFIVNNAEGILNRAKLSAGRKLHQDNGFFDADPVEITELGPAVKFSVSRRPRQS